VLNFVEALACAYCAMIECRTEMVGITHHRRMSAAVITATISPSRTGFLLDTVFIG
jgi:hypothetical protein